MLCKAGCVRGMPAVQKKNFLAAILGEYYLSVLALAGIIIFLAAYFIYFRTEIKKFSSEGEYDPARYEIELGARNEAFKNLRDSLAILNTVTKNDKEKISRFLPGAPGEPDIVTSLSTIIRDSGMVLLSIDTKSGFEVKGSPLKGLKTVEVTLSFGGGDYIGFKSLLESLEKNLRIMDIESFAYNPGSNAYSIRLRAYYLE